MAKKLKKVKKQMSPKTRNILVNSFKGIISNQACVDNGREAPWWLAILFALVSVIIPLIPNFVTLDKAYGASFLNNGTFGMDRGLAEAFVDMKANNKHLNLQEDGLLHYYEGTTEKTGEATLYQQISHLPTEGSGQEYTFMMYFTTKEGNDLQDFINDKTGTKYIVGTITKLSPEDPEDTKYYIPTFIVLTNKSLIAATYRNQTTTIAGSTYGGLDWSHTPKGDLVELTTKDLVSTTVEDVSKNRDDWKTVLGRWVDIYNQTYVNQKNRAKWNTTLIYLGVYAGLIVFLGLMVFLLTRGKNNPFNTLNFWVCQKIAYFLSFTPAVLALILGFILSGNMIGQMAFIMLISLRIMWASMRQLRPMYQ